LCSRYFLKVAAQMALQYPILDTHLPHSACMVIPEQAKLVDQAVTGDFASDCFSPGANSYLVNIPAGRVKRHHLAQGDWEGDYG
jgi:hypothetical protein